MSESTTNTPRPVAKKQACVECRQQKAKCDAWSTQGVPCSRCRRLSKDCILVGTFQREHKRKRLSELERQTRRLHMRLGVATTASEEIRSPTPTTQSRASGGPMITDPVETLLPTPATDVQQSDALTRRPVSPFVEDDQEFGVTQPTYARSLEGLHMSAEDIDSLFDIFFTDYLPLLPIMDHKVLPNACYQQSPFLFWTIIGTACRTYPRNPNILGALSAKLVDMALLSVSNRKAPLQRLQSFLLILTWAYPDSASGRSLTRTETSFALAGILLQLAIKAGLHLAEPGGQFWRLKGGDLPEISLAKRCDLWALCIVAYQKTCLCRGFLGRASFDIFPDEESYRILVQNVSPDVKLQLKLQDIIVRCSIAATELGLRRTSLEKGRALSILIRSAESQVRALELESSSTLGHLACVMARLCVHTFYTYVDDSSQRSTNFEIIQSSGCRAIRGLSKYMDTLAAPTMVSIYDIHSLMLSSVLLLRILKSRVPLASGREEGMSCFYLGMDLIKQTSADKSDLSAKCAVYLMQLWDSPQAFKNSDGSDCWTRKGWSRLIGGPLVDSMFWWRELFDSKRRTIVNDTSEARGTDQDGSLLPGTTVVTNAQQPPLGSDNDFGYFDFDWAIPEDLAWAQDLTSVGLNDSGGLLGMQLSEPTGVD
ncbi:hypothetical protein K461DRAFT_97567 [Myriangium duriaei CBS 260.36]|uniref:Zn(2)-C6 fungal-type domain-containing protein n=1 Tax=Myriangium duriaei CBS 260.36 TaxID=1168546 RepID=A0A9P4MLT4_9PEZI|nr:hypothetical protein K461DRAFT_97567 [Myriangium duriaei CBS 260.36]